MMKQNDAQILTLLAAEDPGYGALSARYRAALAGVEVPEDFAADTLAMLRTDPDMAAKIDQYERGLDRAQSFGLENIEQAVLLAAALIVLLKPNVDFKTEWDFKVFKGGLKINTASVDEKILRPVFNVVSMIAKKLLEGLASLSTDAEGKTDSSSNK